jgi:hypothetical protein
MQRLASGNCSRKPEFAGANYHPGLQREYRRGIVSRLGTDPVATLRMTALSQMATEPPDQAPRRGRRARRDNVGQWAENGWPEWIRRWCGCISARPRTGATGVGVHRH